MDAADTFQSPAETAPALHAPAQTELHRTNWVWTARLMFVLAVCCLGMVFSMVSAVKVAFEESAVIRDTGQRVFDWHSVTMGTADRDWPSGACIAGLAFVAFLLMITVESLTTRATAFILAMFATLLLSASQPLLFEWGKAAFGGEAGDVARELCASLDYTGPIGNLAGVPVENLPDSAWLNSRAMEHLAQFKGWTARVWIIPGGFGPGAEVVLRNQHGRLYFFSFAGAPIMSGSSPGSADYDSPPANGWLLHLIRPGYPSNALLQLALMMLMIVCHGAARQVGSPRIGMMAFVVAGVALIAGVLMAIAGLAPDLPFQLVAIGAGTLAFGLATLLLLTMWWRLRKMRRQQPLAHARMTSRDRAPTTAM